MPANVQPIFSRLGSIGIPTPPINTANTTTDLTAGTSYLIFTADATNGSYVDRLIFQALGTNVATVGRVWVNNGGVVTTASNQSQIADVTLPATVVSQVAGVGNTVVQLGFALAAGYKIYVTIGTTVAAGFDVTVIGGVY